MKRFPVYGCCVMKDVNDDEYYIPLDRMGEHVVMLGRGHGRTMHLKGQNRQRPLVTLHLFTARYMHKHMKPVGPLAVVIVGQRMENGISSPIGYPRLDPKKPALMDMYQSPTTFDAYEFSELIIYARQRAYTSDPRLLPSIYIGTVPGVWYLFCGWMHEHRRVRGSHVRRIGAHFRSVNTVVTVGTCKWVRGRENWVDRRLAE